MDPGDQTILADATAGQVSFLFSWPFGFIYRKTPSTSKGRKLPAAQIYIHTTYNSEERDMLSLSTHLSSHTEGLLLVPPRAHMPTVDELLRFRGCGFLIGPDLNMCSPPKAEIKQTTLGTTLLIFHGMKVVAKGKKLLNLIHNIFITNRHILENTKRKGRT